MPFPKAPSKKGVKRLRQPVSRPEPVKSKKAKTGGKYDLWDAGMFSLYFLLIFASLDFVPKIDLEYKEAGEHILRDSKKKLPKKPETLRMKASILRAVALPGPGASYNPSADDYKVFILSLLQKFILQEYVEKIVIEEQQLIDEESRIQRGLKPKKEKMVTEVCFFEI